MTYGLRRATAHDAAAISAIARAAYAPYVERIGREPAPMVADFPSLLDAGYVTVASDDSDVVVGYAVSYVREAGDMHLENVAVAPQFHSRGLGRLLIDFVEKNAVANGCHRITLYTNAAMTENLTLYPCLGYRETHRALEHGFKRVFFEKLLRSYWRVGASDYECARCFQLPADFEVVHQQAAVEGIQFLERMLAEFASGANRFDKSGEALFVVQFEGDTIGVCGLDRDPYAVQPINAEHALGRLRHLYVAPTHRRLGIARRLVSFALAAATAFARLRLRCLDAEFAHFYDATGWQRITDEYATHMIEPPHPFGPAPSPWR